MKYFWLILVVIILFFIGWYLWPSSEDSVVVPIDRSGSEQIVIEDEELAREAAISRSIVRFTADSSIAAEEIGSVDVEAESWADACLGLPGADEMCAQVVTPGQKVTITTQAGVKYVYRTNADGTTIRRE